MTTPLPPMLPPAILAEADAQRVDAHAALNRAMATPSEATARAAADAADLAADAARATADALAEPVILALLEYHRIPAPSPQALGDLVAAMHAESFAPLAQLSDNVFNHPHGVMLALRRAWRRHHGRLEEASGRVDIDDISVNRAVLSSTFGGMAFVIEDEWRVGDEFFRGLRILWHQVHPTEGGGIPDDASGAPGPDDPQSPPPTYRATPPLADRRPSASLPPIAGPSRLPELRFSPLPDYPHANGSLSDPAAHTSQPPIASDAPVGASALNSAQTIGQWIEDTRSETGSATEGTVTPPAPQSPIRRDRLVIRIPVHTTRPTAEEASGNGSQTGAETTTESVRSSSGSEYEYETDDDVDA